MPYSPTQEKSVVLSLPSAWGTLKSCCACLSDWRALQGWDLVSLIRLGTLRAGCEPEAMSSPPRRGILRLRAVLPLAPKTPWRAPFASPENLARGSVHRGSQSGKHRAQAACWVDPTAFPGSPFATHCGYCEP